MSARPTILIIIASLLVIFAARPVLAQTSIPSPQPGLVQSDFAKDVNEGQKSIQNNANAKNIQNQIDQNETDMGEQGDIQDETLDEIKLDENVDQDEAQEKIEETESPQPTGLESEFKSPEPTKTPEPLESPERQ